MNLPTVKVAAAHIAPVYMNATASLDKALDYIAEAAAHDAELVVFPESFIPGFPVWAALWAPIYNHGWFEKMVKNSLRIDGPEIERLKHAAQQYQISICMGFSEISSYSVGCLWNACVLINPQGEIVNHHRKLVPTFFEKMVWAAGDGAGLQVVDSRIGKVGVLICGENTNPLARYSLMAQGEQIHISLWPSIWPTKNAAVGDNFDNLSANKIRAGAHSFEAKCFGIMSASYMDAAMKAMLIDGDASVEALLNASPQAATMFVDPRGFAIGDLLQHQEGLAYASFDLNQIIELKQLHDVVGYYNRFDVFELKVNRSRLRPIAFAPQNLRSDEPSDLSLGSDEF
jgi:nitrilase